MQSAAIITEQHDNDSWGERFTSTSVIGIMLQKPGEDHYAFRDRVYAKVADLEAETYGSSKRRVHWGVDAKFHSVIDPDPAFTSDGEIDD